MKKKKREGKAKGVIICLVASCYHYVNWAICLIKIHITKVLYHHGRFDFFDFDKAVL